MSNTQISRIKSRRPLAVTGWRCLVEFDRNVFEFMSSDHVRSCPGANSEHSVPRAGSSRLLLAIYDGLAFTAVHNG